MNEVPTDQRPSLLPVVIGFALAGAVLLAVSYWAAKRQNRPAVEGPPAVTLVSPSRDTAIGGGPLTITFETHAQLRLGPTGWAAGRYHLHALIDGTELMPGAKEIRRVGRGRYTWTVSAPSPGVLQLVWALPNHTRLSEGASSPIRLLPQ